MANIRRSLPISPSHSNFANRYLPAYSPDLNPIERLFSKLKAALRSAVARTVEALIEAMGEALRAVRPGDIQGWFGHSGYPTASSTVTVNEKPL